MMGQGKNAIFVGDPKIVARMILMVMRIDHCIEGWKFFTDFQESLPATWKTCINEKSIDIKGIDLENGDSKKPAGHVNETHRTISFKVYGISVHG
jgi:hypothetical protein